MNLSMKSFAVALLAVAGGANANAATPCATEGGTCSFTGTHTVFYGANGTFVSKSLTNGTPCNNTVFGDPIFGAVKACYLDTNPSLPPPAVQTPASVSFSPAGTLSVTDNAAVGTVLAGVQVTASDGKAFTGTISISSQSKTGMASLSSTTLPSNVQVASMSSANDGAQTVTVQATENSVSKSATLSINVNPSVTTTLVTTLDGAPLAGPSGSDCQVYKTGATVAITCPLAFIPVTGTHTVQPNEWGAVLVASGGGTVTITLPTTTAAGRNVVSFATDGKTAITLVPQAPAVMQGSNLIKADGTLSVGAGSSGWAGLASPNLYEVIFK